MNPETVSNEAQAAPATAPQPRRASGKTLAFWALAALNVVLAVVVVNRHTPDNPAHAQAARPSDFLMVPGNVTGVSTGMVFVVDTSTGKFSAFTYDDTRRSLDVMPSIDLTNVFKTASGVGTAGTPGKGPKPR